MEEQSSLLIQNKYKIIKFIGKGNYSHVYEGLHVIKNEKVAIKFDIQDNNISKKLLQNEISVYLKLLKHKTNHIANIKSFGLIGSRNYIIMDYLYMDLGKYFEENYNKISIENINILLNNVFILIHNMHKTKIVHRDIKPDNFLFNNKNELCVIDLGLSTDLDDIKSSNKIIGTPLFCSYNIHQKYYCYETHDDAISIYFMFFYLIGRQLPWENIHINDETIKQKVIYTLKKYTNFMDYYKHNANYENLLPIIKSYKNYLENNEILFYS